LFCLREGNGAGLDRKKGGKITNPLMRGVNLAKKKRICGLDFKRDMDKQTTIRYYNMDIGKII
jgi:hypothetical protein